MQSLEEAAEERRKEGGREWRGGGGVRGEMWSFKVGKNHSRGVCGGVSTQWDDL